MGRCKAVTRLGSSIEAEAIKWTVSVIGSFQYKNVKFESDSLTLTRMVNGEEEVWHILKSMIEVIHR